MPDIDELDDFAHAFDDYDDDQPRGPQSYSSTDERQPEDDVEAEE